MGMIHVRKTMRRILRNLAAVMAGLILAFMLVVAVEIYGAVVHPLPQGFGGTQEEMCRHVEQFPAWVLASVVPAWGATAFLSAWLARRIADTDVPPSNVAGATYASLNHSAAVVGFVLAAAVVVNVSMLPYPMWFKIACLLVVPWAAVAGSRSRGQNRTANIGDSSFSHQARR